jgi:hypothetical protein
MFGQAPQRQPTPGGQVRSQLGQTHWLLQQLNPRAVHSEALSTVQLPPTANARCGARSAASGASAAPVSTPSRLRRGPGATRLLTTRSKCKPSMRVPHTARATMRERDIIRSEDEDVRCLCECRLDCILHPDGRLSSGGSAADQADPDVSQHGTGRLAGGGSAARAAGRRRSRTVWMPEALRNAAAAAGGIPPSSTGYLPSGVYQASGACWRPGSSHSGCRALAHAHCSACRQHLHCGRRW